MTVRDTASVADDAHTTSGSASNVLWADLRAALRGTNADYTRIPLKRAVFLLAVPMMLELVLESTFAVVDIFFVAKLGSSAVATVGLTETYCRFLLYSIAMGLAMAVTAIVARRVGEHRGEEAALSAVQAIVVALLVSLPFAVATTSSSANTLPWDLSRQNMNPSSRSWRRYAPHTPPVRTMRKKRGLPVN